MSDDGIIESGCEIWVDVTKRSIGSDMNALLLAPIDQITIIEIRVDLPRRGKWEDKKLIHECFHTYICQKESNGKTLFWEGSKSISKRSSIRKFYITSICRTAGMISASSMIYSNSSCNVKRSLLIIDCSLFIVHY